MCVCRCVRTSTFCLHCSPNFQTSVTQSPHVISKAWYRELSVQECRYWQNGNHHSWLMTGRDNSRMQNIYSFLETEISSSLTKTVEILLWKHHNNGATQHPAPVSVSPPQIPNKPYSHQDRSSPTMRDWWHWPSQCALTKNTC